MTPTSRAAFTPAVVRHLPAGCETCSGPVGSRGGRRLSRGWGRTASPCEGLDTCHGTSARLSVPRSLVPRRLPAPCHPYPITPVGLCRPHPAHGHPVTSTEFSFSRKTVTRVPPRARAEPTTQIQGHDGEVPSTAGSPRERALAVGQEESS